MKMHIKTMLMIISAGALLSFTQTAFAKHLVHGTVKKEDGTPASGYRVRIWDADSGGDELMGEVLTDHRGRYRVSYRNNGWDGPASDVHTFWRPDIYIVVSSLEPNGDWKPVDRSGEYSNHRMSRNIQRDFRIPPTGQCPYPAKFDTRSRAWNGCHCPLGSYKRWLDLLKMDARCAKGDSPRDNCIQDGGQWHSLGPNSTRGVCVPAVTAFGYPNPLAYLRREAYKFYFEGIKVKTHPLAPWLIKRYQQYFPHLNLKDVEIAESPNLVDVAMTDCKRIYFPGNQHYVNSLKTELSADNGVLCLPLHELRHADQCMGMNPHSSATRRERYADMWFAQLPDAVIFSILDQQWPSASSIHNHMPMETDADRVRNQIMSATGTGACD